MPAEHFETAVATAKAPIYTCAYRVGLHRGSRFSGGFQVVQLPAKP